MKKLLSIAILSFFLNDLQAQFTKVLERACDAIQGKSTAGLTNEEVIAG